MGFIAAYVPLLDPTYTEDFWTKPGYIAESSSALQTRIQTKATVVRVIDGPPLRSQFMVSTQLELSNVPTVDLTNTELVGVSGEGAGSLHP